MRNGEQQAAAHTSTPGPSLARGGVWAGGACPYGPAGYYSTSLTHRCRPPLQPGTVREVLLQVCEAEGIPVRLQPPMLADVDQWEGALVSSTSRLALPVDRITLPAADGGGERTVEFTASPVTRRIAALVQDAIAANSTLVF